MSNGNEIVEAPQNVESIPRETPETEISSILAEEDPAVIVVRLEKAAELAPRFEAALKTILIASTFPEDWEQFGEGEKAKVCLASAGAERVAKHFPIQFFEIQAPQKIEWTDEIGKAYRYIYRGKARLGEKIISAQGIYSTRDLFLGKAHGKFKTLEEINEKDIQMAAYHIFMGNAIKALLGLRAMPVSQYKMLMERTGQDVTATTSHRYGKGTKGGTSTDDHAKQKELAEACIAIANAGKAVEKDDKGKSKLADQDKELVGLTDSLGVAKSICETISAFTGKDGEVVNGLPASQLKGKRLEITLKTAKTLEKQL